MSIVSLDLVTEAIVHCLQTQRLVQLPQLRVSCSESSTDTPQTPYQVVSPTLPLSPSILFSKPFHQDFGCIIDRLLRRHLSPLEENAAIKQGDLARSTSGNGSFLKHSDNRLNQYTDLGLPHYPCRVRRNFIAWWSYRAYKVAELPCTGCDPWLCPSPPSQLRQPSYSPYLPASASEVLDPLLVAPREALKMLRVVSLGQLSPL